MYGDEFGEFACGHNMAKRLNQTQEMLVICRQFLST